MSILTVSQVVFKCREDRGRKISDFCVQKPGPKRQLHIALAPSYPYLYNIPKLKQPSISQSTSNSRLAIAVLNLKCASSRYLPPGCRFNIDVAKYFIRVMAAVRPPNVRAFVWDHTPTLFCCFIHFFSLFFWLFAMAGHAAVFCCPSFLPRAGRSNTVHFHNDATCMLVKETCPAFTLNSGACRLNRKYVA